MIALATENTWRQWIALIAAVVLLNISLAFHNIWPTPAVGWRGELSIEVALALIALAVAVPWLGRPSPRWLRALTVVWLLLAVGHYADVTAAALFGRDVNLYWDLRFIPDVTQLFTSVANAGLIAGAVVAVALVLALLWMVIRWALGCVVEGMTHPWARGILVLLALVVVALYVFQPPLIDYEEPAYKFATPVTGTYARQVRVAVRAMTGAASLPPSPPMQSDFSRLQGADVLLVFLESYGAISYDKPWLADSLATSRATLASAIRDTHRDVVSAFVGSPTFGGSSWLAHITLLSGIDVREPDTNALLMTQKRDTLVTAFGRAGYRTVALMPGLWQQWPEGSFYGFQHIYGGLELDYHGPEFGWFDIPDQYALAKLDALEQPYASQSSFVFFPTITTHTPFYPTPPYQTDWPRLLTNHPFDDADLEKAFAEGPNWMDLSPSYADSIGYTLTTIAGYLRQHPDRDLVLILVGDHQPPAMLSGLGAPWDVPVHVIANRREVLDRLLVDGFTAGLTPARPHLGGMQALLPALLDAFGDR